MSSWHTTHRPRQIKDLHLTSVRNVLSQLMASGKLPQVFLFAGPKGTGKTSASRIIAAMVNDPANEALVDHLFFKGSKPKQSVFQEPAASAEADKIINGASYAIQEMDAASNRGIDDVRALKEKVYLPPQGSKMAVYILDEAHMLTNEAFNALLKLLEEPPAHALFILATTELHKIPETIVSRATLVRFQTASDEEIRQALEQVAKAENVAFDSEALTRIAQVANGSFRDAVKLLEQVAGSGQKITLEVVQQHHVGPLDAELAQLVQAVVEKNEAAVVTLIQGLRAKGYASQVVQVALLQLLHQSLLQSLQVIEGEPRFPQAISLFLLNELKTLPRDEVSPIPLLTLELKLLDIISRAKQKGPGGGTQTKTQKKTQVSETDTLVSEIPLQASTVTDSIPEPESESHIHSDNLVIPDNHLGEKLVGIWEQFVNKVAEENATVAAFLRSAKPMTTSNGVARVAVFYQFHKDQLQQPKFMSLIQECAEPLLGGKPGFEFVVDKGETLADDVLM
ncbi:MAG TPA: DNA polymerase III subunit gamma/tau [Patescibacteria group bacterium]